MDIVEQFVACRRKGDAECAIALLAPNASVGSPWSYHHGDKDTARFLRDEVHFDKRDYVENNAPIECISGNIFQRKYNYDAGKAEYPPFHHPFYRETYFVKDGKISFVGCSKQNLSLGRLYGFWKQTG